MKFKELHILILFFFTAFSVRVSAQHYNGKCGSAQFDSLLILVDSLQDVEYIHSLNHHLLNQEIPGLILAESSKDSNSNRFEISDSLGLHHKILVMTLQARSDTLVLPKSIGNLEKLISFQVLSDYVEIPQDFIKCKNLKWLDIPIYNDSQTSEIIAELESLQSLTVWTYTAKRNERKYIKSLKMLSKSKSLYRVWLVCSWHKYLLAKIISMKLKKYGICMEISLTRNMKN